MTITNPYMIVITFALSVFIYIIYTKFFMIVANFIGEKLGIGKIVVKLFEMKNRKK